MKVLIISLLLVGCLTRVNAQKKFDHYQTMVEGFELRAGDTIQFLKGSLGGQFVHVYTLWGRTPPTRAAFQGANSKMLIDYFKRKKNRGVEKVYAVSKIPNVKNVLVYTEIESALKSKEIKFENP